MEKIKKVTDEVIGEDSVLIERKCSICGETLIKSKDGKTFECPKGCK